MIFAKKSLGQNYLIDNNIIKKIINIVKIKDKNIIEIGPGQGALTDEILRRNPNSLSIIEKDFNLYKKLKEKYSNLSNVKIYNEDILKFNIENIIKNKSSIFGNLPYNISSQILIKFLKFKKWPPKFQNLVFMFQKELGDKIIGKYSSSNYGRLSIISNYKLKLIKKFLVSPNCFFPKPKVTSLVIHAQPKNKNIFRINNLDNLEKVTNILFSNRRKMINKNLIKLLNKTKIKKIKGIKLTSRPSEISPEIYYKIAELYEGK